MLTATYHKHMQMHRTEKNIEGKPLERKLQKSENFLNNPILFPVLKYKISLLKEIFYFYEGEFKI